MFAVRRLAASTSAPLLLRRLSAQPKPKAPAPTPSDNGAGKRTDRKAALSLLGITGAAVAAVTYDTYAFNSRTSLEYISNKVMEKAAQNQQIASAMGGPMALGFWHGLSFAWNLWSHSVSGTVGVSGPQCDGLLTFEAVRSRDKSWFSDLEILTMDAILDVRTEDGKHQKIRVRIPESTADPPAQEKTRYFYVTQNAIIMPR